MTVDTPQSLVDEILAKSQDEELLAMVDDYLTNIPDTDRSNTIFSSAFYLAVTRRLDEGTTEEGTAT